MAKLFLGLALLTLIIFTYISYTVARERWNKFDFDTTVKLQDHIPTRFDDNFSIFSLLGSAEVTVGICIIMAILALIKWNWKAVLGWAMIVPASAVEVFGKLVLYHPGPPVFLHRTTLETHLPSFYIHTEFSYPSGHMTRTVFVLTIFFCLILFSQLPKLLKGTLLILIIAFTTLMTISRISLGEHWTSDVVGGAVLGLAFAFAACGLIFLKQNKAHEKSKFVNSEHLL